MGWLEAIVLGIVQGLTEFLPVSSSAHQLIVAQLFFNGHDPGSAFTAVTQLGTESAVILIHYPPRTQVQMACLRIARLSIFQPDKTIRCVKG